MAQIPTDLHTHLAWQFDSVLPGHFSRAKADYADIEFPILSPLPDRKSSTRPREGADQSGPFVYLVVDRHGDVQYIGKTKEKTVIKRWVRPGVGGPASHYWSHTNKRAGCVRRIAAGILAGHGPYQLRFTSAALMPRENVERFAQLYPHLDALEQIEKGLMSALRPGWNDTGTYR